MTSCEYREFMCVLYTARPEITPRGHHSRHQADYSLNSIHYYFNLELSRETVAHPSGILIFFPIDQESRLVLCPEEI